MYLLTPTDYLKSKVDFFFQISDNEIGLIMRKITQTEGSLYEEQWLFVKGIN